MRPWKDYSWVKILDTVESLYSIQNFFPILEFFGTILNPDRNCPLYFLRVPLHFLKTKIPAWNRASVVAIRVFGQLLSCNVRNLSSGNVTQNGLSHKNTGSTRPCKCVSPFSKFLCRFRPDDDVKWPKSRLCRVRQATTIKFSIFYRYTHTVLTNFIPGKLENTSRAEQLGITKNDQNNAEVYF